ncbi:adenylate/guanylate cyclase domain-containing protein [Mycobacterium sp. NPDC051804]|uniref:adenylate/guanylate cyclase domain-containing protein n=1 Tax=Mycobacterium sp. NPDC051804 TaxID=3364295 RepID=UPI003790E64E
MDRIWQWAWDRYGARYSWVIWLVAFANLLVSYLSLSFLVVAYEKSNRFVDALVLSGVAAAILALVIILPGSRTFSLGQARRKRRPMDDVKALEQTYRWTRAAGIRGMWSMSVCGLMLLPIVGVITGASASRLLQYAVVGVTLGIPFNAFGMHFFLEGAVRPLRGTLTGDTGIGDSLPRARPTFAAWVGISMVASAFTFTFVGAMLGAVLDPDGGVPALAVVIAGVITAGIGVPLALGAMTSAGLRPIRDLAEATERVGVGDYSQRVPVVQDDDLGVLAASFNRMQTGLAERQRLQAAFGTYVDPVLASRLLEQGDDVFTGERREVTVMFVDIRDFTPFAEANPAEDVVARLNALFEIVVPAVVDAGGHVNKFLGDGALAVFGAPNDLADHADAALNAAVLIHRMVAERFGQELRIGIGINTGTVIAGTIGGGSKLEFTLIGDTVNVAARVEQLTKTTSDTILLTEQSVDALTSRPPELVDRKSHALKGKSAATRVFGIETHDHVASDSTNRSLKTSSLTTPDMSDIVDQQ